MKKIFAIVLSLVMMASLFAACAPAQQETIPSFDTSADTTEAGDAHVHDAGNDRPWKAWESTDSLPGTDDTEYNYYLTADVTVADTVAVYQGADVVVCLNGFQVNAPQYGQAYNLCEGSRVTLCDCTGDGIVFSGTNGCAFQLNGASTHLILRDLTVDGSQADGEAAQSGPIHINQCAGRVTLDGATIQNCTAKNGAAIRAVGMPNSSATVEITNGSLIKGNTVLKTSEGSAAVVGYCTNILISDSTLTENKSYAICGVAVSFATQGGLVLHNATITNNQSLFDDYTNMQVGAVYIHNGNRSVTISGDTVIDGNTNVDGTPADLYLQRTVRETDPAKYPYPLQITLGQLTDNASINILPGLGYEYEWFRDDLNSLPLMVLDTSADPTVWNNNWVRVDSQDAYIVYDSVAEEFVSVKDTQ